jgi:hypothetical protein
MHTVPLNTPMSVAFKGVTASSVEGHVMPEPLAAEAELARRK